MSKKTILLTGSAGFIFSNFIRKSIYLKLPYRFVSVDKINSQKNMINLYVNQSHKFYLADIADTHIIDTIFSHEKPDVVINGAAESSVDKSLTDPLCFALSNVVGTQNLLNAAIKHDVKRFIQISTDEVYGQLTVDEKPWKEEAPLNPRNPYSASKASAELMVQAAGKSHGLPYIITRSSNNYGPRQMPDKLIPRVIQCIMRGEKIPVYGEGSQLRDWTHVFDNCAAISYLIDNGKDNEIYNISAHQEFTNLEIVNKICDIMGTGHNLISFIPDPRKSHDFRYAIDTSKIESLGFKASMKFKDHIKEVVEWYKMNSYFLLQ